MRFTTYSRPATAVAADGKVIVSDPPLQSALTSPSVAPFIE